MISRRKLFALGGAAAVAPMLPNVAASGGIVAPPFTPIPSFEAYRLQRIEAFLASPEWERLKLDWENVILYGDPNESHPFDGLLNVAVDTPTPEE